jgi:hypothetical protein
MTLQTYNGFDHAKRMRALRWLKKEYCTGRRSRPVVCDACGQTEGPIEAHSEDYSEPFGNHIGRFGLCWRCHMAIHCRFKNSEAWSVYKAHVREGRIFAPIGRNFALFCQQTLKRKGVGVAFKHGPARGRTILDNL